MANQIPPIDREKLIIDLLGSDKVSVGNRLPVLIEIIDNVDKFDHGFTIAELITWSEELISSYQVLSITGSSIAMLSAVFMPVKSMIDIVNAMELGHRMYAFRCIAYTITAWAYKRGIPLGSLKTLHNVRVNDPRHADQLVKEYKEVWRKTSLSVLIKLNSKEYYKDVPQEAIRVILRALSNDDPQTLCLILLKGYETDIPTTAKAIWKNTYDIRFPF